MTKHKKSIEVTEKILQCAKTFQNRHKDEKGIRSTFGWYHRSSTLNHKRLVALLSILQHHRDWLDRNLRVVDFGSGSGLITSAISLLDYPVVGLETNSTKVTWARKFADEESTGAKFIEADYLRFEDWVKKVETELDGLPEVVVLANILRRVPDAAEFLDQLMKWLPRETLLLIHENNPESPIYWLRKVLTGWVPQKLLPAKPSVRYRSYRGWKQLLETRGFRPSPPVGLDPLPGIAFFAPENARSLVFTAFRS